jgi:hypothetical protein
MRTATVVTLAALLAFPFSVLYYAWIGLMLPGEPMPVQGYVAMIIGVVLSLAVGIGLMVLLFYSSRRGYDEPPHLQDRRGKHGG